MKQENENMQNKIYKDAIRICPDLKFAENLILHLIKDEEFKLIPKVKKRMEKLNVL